MIDIGPVPRFAGAKSAIEHPIVRDMDTNMYERQDGSGLEVGSYAHRPILYDPEDIPSIEEAALSPTEFPFTQDDFVAQMEHALELMPEIVGDESVGIKYAINGLLSLTPDGLPVLGETPEVKATGRPPRCGSRRDRASAARSPSGWSRASPRSTWWFVRHRPLHPHQRTAPNTSRHGRASTSTRPTGSCIQASSGRSYRNVRLSPFHARAAELGAVFYEALGGERPHWYESNAGPVEEFGVQNREAEWDRRWWSPIINAEHLAMRDRVAMFDLTAFCVFDVIGAGALDSRSSGCRCATDGRDARQGRLHAGADAARRLSLRPHRHADRGRALPRGHRRRARHGRLQVVLGTTPVPTRRSSTSHRAGARSGYGGRGRARCSSGRRAPTSRTRASLCRPSARSSWARCPCSRRGSRTSATSAGSSTCRSSRARSSGTSSGRRASHRRRARGDRRVRHHRPAAVEKRNVRTMKRSDSALSTPRSAAPNSCRTNAERPPPAWSAICMLRESSSSTPTKFCCATAALTTSTGRNRQTATSASNATRMPARIRRSRHLTRVAAGPIRDHRRDRGRTGQQQRDVGTAPRREPKLTLRENDRTILEEKLEEAFEHNPVRDST